MSFLIAQREKASGKILWKFDRGMFLAAVINEVAYLWTHDKTIALVEMETGKLLKTITPESDVCLVPNTGSDKLFAVKGTEIYGVK